MTPCVYRWFCLFAASLVCVTAAHAGQEIGRVTIAGNVRVDAAVVKSHVVLRETQAYDPALAQKSLQALYGTGLFKTVAVDRQGSDVVITVVENPTLASVSFTGNTDVAKSLLEQEVKLAVGQPVTLAKAQAAALRVRDVYRHQGRIGTTVASTLEPMPDNRVKLVFTIQEGPVMKNIGVGFSGNRAFTDKQLRDVMASSVSGWFDILKTSASYDAQRLELDRELLLIHYRKNGFPDAKVLPAEAVETEAQDGYRISFTIEEGDRFSFGETKINTTLSGVNEPGLAKHMLTVSGQTYNVELIERTKQRLTVALVEAGQPYARVSAVPKRDATARTIALIYTVTEGPHVTIERINVHGNTKTKDWVIRRELQEAEGDPLSQVLADRDQARLKRLGLFKTVAMKANPGSAPDKAVLDIDVTEQDTSELSFGAGYSSSEGVIGDVMVSDSNLFGNGQMARVKLSGSQTRLQADIGFTEPHLFDSWISGGFDLLYKDADYTKQSSYKSTMAGGDVRLGTNLSDTTAFGLSYGLTRNEIYSVGPLASAAIKEAANGGTSGSYYTSAVGASATYDDRNSKKTPTSGSYFMLGQDFAGIGGDSQFIRNTAEGRLYYPLSDSVTLVGRATAGNISGWGGQDVRLLDLFQKGGDAVRGFAPGGIGPRDTASANQDALGGKSYVAATAEARFALPFVPDEIGLKGAVFTDAGSLFGTTKAANALPGVVGGTAAARVSVGAGLIWDSPVGSLGVTYAVPVAKQPFDKLQPLSFGVMPY
jgi:outer membrane protein insertion porin family